jgi:thiamine-phosphate pyrophosphorylase
MHNFLHTGLYAIVDDIIHKNYGLVRLLTQIIHESAISVVQLRLKTYSQKQKKDLMIEIFPLKKIRPIIFIMNDDLDFLDTGEIDGVHLGQNDIPLPLARKNHPGKILGLSTHNVNEAKLAVEAGADYIGCGAIFSTSTKNDTVSLGLEGLKKIVNSVSVPTVAIGGINSHNMAYVARTGCTMAAAISGLIEEGKFVGQKLHEIFKKSWADTSIGPYKSCDQ